MASVTVKKVTIRPKNSTSTRRVTAKKVMVKDAMDKLRGHKR